MRRIAMALVAFMSVVAVGLFAFPTGASADPGPRPWNCPSGRACFYDSEIGYNTLFIAERCGEHDLRGGIYQNKISAIRNNTGGTVWVWVWRNAGYWQLHGWVDSGKQGSFYTNDIDKVEIDCPSVVSR